ncbi:39S ribosomal protein L47, mitochondrial [Homalodisca vitripennis]|nr:39S ribosomal protein L47, mitochondrial [Homalodisca vitripennis]
METSPELQFDTSFPSSINTRYVLLKERNMLMSMEHECKEAFEVFPNPERLDKVKESMHNLEEVVIERNKAYHELETGETGIRPAKTVTNQIGKC